MRMFVPIYFEAADSKSDDRFALSDPVFYLGHWGIAAIHSRWPSTVVSLIVIFRTNATQMSAKLIDLFINFYILLYRYIEVYDSL